MIEKMRLMQNTINSLMGVRNSLIEFESKLSDAIDENGDEGAHISENELNELCFCLYEISRNSEKAKLILRDSLNEYRKQMKGSAVYG